MLNTIISKLTGRYAPHDEAVIISCFFNPMRSPYRLRAFDQFYGTIKHLNHRIVECVIGDTEPQLQPTEFITHVHTESLLWHKETLLNGLVKTLPARFKYVFWVDADVLFTNRNWVVEGVEQLRQQNIIQPFEYCVHLEKDEESPSFDLGAAKARCGRDDRHKSVWRSFCANWRDGLTAARSENYDRHGHVGFAWGARREVLERCPLYDRALIGGADHIIAHAAAGQVPHPCITRSFGDDIAAVEYWSREFHRAVRGRIGYVKGDLFHLWHGDIDKRQYLKRIQDFTPTTRQITQRDSNGLHVATQHDEAYVRRYFHSREVAPYNHDDGFIQSMMLGYMTDSGLIGGMAGGNFSGALLGSMMRDTSESHHDSPVHHEPAPEPEHHHVAPETNATPAVIEAPVLPDQASAECPTTENFS